MREGPYVPGIGCQEEDLFQCVDGLRIQPLCEVEVRQLRPGLGIGWREVEKLYESRCGIRDATHGS